MSKWAEWVEILWGFTKCFFKQKLKVSSFYLEKQKVLFLKKYFFSGSPYQNKKALFIDPIFSEDFGKTHPENNWRELWIAWNIGSVNHQKIRLLTIIYLYSQDYFHHPFNWMPIDRFEALFRISYTYPCSGRCTSTSWRYVLFVADFDIFWPFFHI